ncbi:MAG: transcriptional repressor LexA [Acidobacteriota bacterium]|nr:MAG: repressor LexA [Acidobacteriota bacterium]
MAYTPPGETRRRVYRWVRERLLAGEPPTVREVQRQFGFRAVESARAHLEALVREGLLEKAPGRARGWRLPGPPGGGGPPRLVPLLGRVQAGDLQAAIEDPEGWLPVGSRPAAEELFALRVRGESMTGAGILPGDIVVVRRQPDARPGEIVVALVGDEATVKTLRRRGRRIVLEPANPAFEPIVPDPRELQLLGKVVEVHRYLETPALVERPPA